jgi:VWFA-related protein
MKTPRALAIVTAWLVGLAPAWIAVGQRLPTFRAGVDLVAVDVSVTRGGRPVAGLKLENFIVLDNGVRQKLEGMVTERVPLDATLVLDASGSLGGGRLIELKRAAETFLSGLSAQDRVSLMTFSHKVLLRCPLTSDFPAVRAALVWTESHGATALYDATYVALRLPEPGQRRVIAILFTDGFDNASWLSPDEVVDAARQSNVIIYGVTRAEYARSPRGAVFATNGGSALDFLRSVSDATGGQLFRTEMNDSLEGAFVRVLENVRARYLLRYSPDRLTPGWHRLEVRLKNAKGDVTARRGYFAAN